MNTRLHIKFMGGFSFELDGAPVPGLKQPRLQSLLALLLITAHAPLTREALASTLWPDESTERARATLRVNFLRLRRAMGDSDIWFDVQPDIISWRLDSPFELDYFTFQTLMGSAPTPENIELASRLGREELLPGFYDDWVVAERDRLKQEFGAFLDRGIRYLEQRGDRERPVRLAEMLLDLDPLDESRCLQLMQLQDSTGHRQSALGTYERFRRQLKQELGEEPSPKLREFNRSLLWAHPPLTAVSAPDNSLVGRDVERMVLRRLERESRARGGRMVVLEGESGIGKTRLAQDLLGSLEKSTRRTLVTGCFSPEEHLTLAPVLTLLRGLEPSAFTREDGLALAQLLPKLEAGPFPAAVPITPRPLREVLDAAVRVLLGQGPLVILVDDIQWCDRESLAFFDQLLKQHVTFPLLFMATLNTEGLLADNPTSLWLASLEVTVPVTRLTIQPFNLEETRLLGERLMGTAFSEVETLMLHENTLGNPLSIVESIMAIQEAGLPFENAQPCLQHPLEARLARTSPPARQLLELVALLETDLSNIHLQELCSRMLSPCRGGLQRAAGPTSHWQERDDSHARCPLLGELTARGLLEVRRPGYVAFPHAAVRETVTKGLRGPQRRLLHLRLAQGLVMLTEAGLEVEPMSIARSYARAGAPLDAARWYLKVAEQSERLEATEEALHHYGLVLSLVGDQEPLLKAASLEGRARCGLTDPGHQPSTHGNANIGAAEAVSAVIAFTDAARGPGFPA